MDARWVPREIQELAYQKGVIPYIPEKIYKEALANTGSYDEEQDELPDNRKKERRSSGTEGSLSVRTSMAMRGNAWRCVAMRGNAWQCVSRISTMKSRNCLYPSAPDE